MQRVRDGARPAVPPGAPLRTGHVVRRRVASTDREDRGVPDAHGLERPWLSSFGTSFSHDFGLGPKEPEPGRYQDGEDFGLSVFLRDGDDVYRTYFTKARGVETLGPVWTLLDLTPLGRQETWEDSPPGYPQTPPYEWWRLHDEYES